MKITPTEVSSQFGTWFQLGGIALLGLHQWYRGRKTERQQSTTQTKLSAVEALMNGDKLELLRQRADLLSTIAIYRPTVGDVERADNASKEYNEAKVNHAILMEHAIQAELDRRELERRKIIL